MTVADDEGFKHLFLAQESLRGIHQTLSKLAADYPNVIFISTHSNPAMGPTEGRTYCGHKDMLTFAIDDDIDNETYGSGYYHGDNIITQTQLPHLVPIHTIDGSLEMDNYAHKTIHLKFRCTAAFHPTRNNIIKNSQGNNVDLSNYLPFTDPTDQNTKINNNNPNDDDDGSNLDHFLAVARTMCAPTLRAYLTALHCFMGYLPFNTRSLTQKRRLEIQKTNRETYKDAFMTNELVEEGDVF